MDFGREQPAGIYDLDITEELIEGLSFLAYRMVSASLVLPLSEGSHSYQLVAMELALVRSTIEATRQRQQDQLPPQNFDETMSSAPLKVIP